MMKARVNILPRTALWSFFSFVLIIGYCGVVWAAGGSAHGPADFSDVNWFEKNQDRPPIFWFVVDFVIFVSILYVALKNRLPAFFKSRHADIRNGLNAAEKKFEEAKSEYDDFQGRLGAVDAEITGLLNKNKANAEHEKNSVIRGAQSYSQRIKEDVERLILQEYGQATSALKVELSKQAIDRAAELLKVGLTEQDHLNLTMQAIVDLEGGVTQEKRGAA
ncbi:MAG: ATP synthase F0 subunit B [Myxococcota bacterium]|nr:ATP synthase F0 subunit B [Myxococcota bacterium]